MADAKDHSDDTATYHLLQTLEKSISDLRALTDCAICSRPFYEPYIISCGHTFCFSCLEQYFSTNTPRRKTCPNCRQPVSHEPAPNYALRDITHALISQPELLLDDETAEKHDQYASEEAGILQKARTKSNVGRGIFGFKFGRLKAIEDAEDGVHRCPRCSWELEHGECLQCGFFGYDSGSDEVEWSSISDESGLSSRSVTSSGHIPHMDFIDLDPSEASMETSSTSSTINPHISRRRAIRIDTADQSSDDEPGSLTGFVVDDENTSMRSSSSLHSDDIYQYPGPFTADHHPWSDVDPSSADDRNSRSPTHEWTDTGTDLLSRSGIADPDEEDTQSSLQIRRHWSHRPSLTLGRTGPGQAARTQTRGFPTAAASTSGNSSRGAPIEIQSSSDEDVPSVRSSNRRPVISSVMSSDNGSNNESDDGENVVAARARRRRAPRARVVLTDDDDVDNDASVSSSVRKCRRPHLRGGGSDSSARGTPSRQSESENDESTTTTPLGSNSNRTTAIDLVPRNGDTPTRDSFSATSSTNRPSTRPLSPASSPSRFPDHGGSSTSARSSQSSRPSALHEAISQTNVDGQASPYRTKQVTPHELSTPRSSRLGSAVPDSPYARALQTLRGIRRNRSPGNYEQRNRLPDFRFDTGSSRANSTANAAAGDRSRLQARRQEKRKAKAERRRLMRLQQVEVGNASSGRVGGIAV